MLLTDSFSVAPYSDLQNMSKALAFTSVLSSLDFPKTKCIKAVQKENLKPMVW